MSCIIVERVQTSGLFPVNTMLKKSVFVWSFVMQSIAVSRSSQALTYGRVDYAIGLSPAIQLCVVHGTRM